MGRRFHRSIAFTLAAVSSTTLAATAGAEPYIAVRIGLKCSVCHVNRTGGGGRSGFGSVWAQTQLPIKSLEVRNRQLNDWAAIGFDLRALSSLAIDRPDANPEAVPRTQVEINEAQIQLEANLINNILALYVDQTVGPDRAFTREAFGLVAWEGRVRGYAKLGKFLLPYGWRVWDEGALFRTVTGFTYSTPDIGLEIGLEPGPLTWSFAVSNGSTGAAESNSEKMLTSSAVVVTQRFRIGASASRNSTPDSKREIVGAFGGLTVGPVTVLGEADLVFDSFDAPATPDRDQLVTYVEGNYLLRQGVNLTVSHGYHEPTVSIRDEATNTPEDQRTRTRVGVETFPTSFVQVSTFYTRLDNAGDTNDLHRVSVELHLHF